MASTQSNRVAADSHGLRPWALLFLATAMVLVGLTPVGQAVRGLTTLLGLLAAGVAVNWRLQATSPRTEPLTIEGVAVIAAALLLSYGYLLVQGCRSFLLVGSVEFQRYFLMFVVLAAVVFAATLVMGLLARLKTPDRQVADRLLPAAMIFLSGTPVLAAMYVSDDDWDWARMFLRVLYLVTLGGAIIWSLPSLGRRIAVSFLILFHFGGILTAVTSVPPPGGPAPWLSMLAWGYVYRPYLGFLYLNNAYHFYSPEPGPPQLLWFFVTYGDDTGRWIKLPQRSESPVPLHYQRLLAMTESTNHLNNMGPPEPRFRELLHRRGLAGSLRSPNIPLHPLLPPQVQYREPIEYSKVMLSSYARFAARAREFQHAENPAIPVRSIKIYRVTHSILSAPQMAAGIDPLDKSLYLPYFQGEFDPDGKLLNPNDPFLYWLIPIYYDDPTMDPNAPFRFPGPSAAMRLVDTLKLHAGEIAPRQEPILP